jgi:hypothetical protein
VGLVLALALGLVIIGGNRTSARRFTGSLSDLMPPASLTEGWSIEARPVAETPEARRAVSELLNFDDAVFATFTRGSTQISLYLAYWSPGRMSPRLVGSHTPDVCWVGSGWKAVARESGRVHLLLDGSRSYPSEIREMSRNGHTEYVIFWHLLVGRDESKAGVAPYGWSAFWHDLTRSGLKGRSEQFFLRISSNAPLDQWWTLPWVQHAVLGVTKAVRPPS